MLINLFLPEQPRLPDMQSTDTRYILAARCWCILRRAAIDPHKRISGYLGCPNATLQFNLLMEVVTQIWPQPFAIFRPCCGGVSVDEMLLVQAIGLANVQTRPQFETLLKEMLPDDALDLFFTRANALKAAGYFQQ
jgi:hypothetical protein